ncbi:hypothetical protein PsorP6_011252 [Peronosclerospora sorghi]|uniref:Uncharacterized protein n=1 Tax=Peronosclerospora sorghi TaxID=230839 RepID=A0ACC0WKG9_9STRA|nr:hypothetical protein PsorP6_011252 [Peronosclerospora sorghi]
MPRATLRTPFNPDHQVDYGVSIASRDAATSKVVSVNFLFYIHFGRDDPDTSTAGVAEPKISNLSPGHFEPKITYSSSAASTKRAGTNSRSCTGTRTPFFSKKCKKFPSQPQEHHSIELRRQTDGNPALHQQSDC